MRNQYIRILFIFCLFLTGCQLLGEEDEQGIFLDMNRAEYARDDTMHISFRNLTGNTLIGGACEFYLEKRTGDGWQTIVSPAIGDISACIAIAYSFEPGYDRELFVRPVEDWMGAGTFRYRYNVYIESYPKRTPSGFYSHGDRWAYSEPFQITR